MAIPVARVHLKMAHGALPALLPTPPKWKTLQLLASPCVAAVLSKPSLAKPSRADADERWDKHKANKPACPASSASPSSVPRSAAASIVRMAPPAPKPCRADAVERWDAHKKAASPAPASSSSSSSSLLASGSKWPISRTTYAERWNVHKKHCCPSPAELLNDGESSSTGSNDMDTEEEEILWKPQAMYAGPGFTVAAPQPSTIPLPTAFLVPVA